jgi:hypothetical protein
MFQTAQMLEAARYSNTRYSTTRLHGVTRPVARVMQVGAMHPLEICKTEVSKTKHGKQHAKKKVRDYRIHVLPVLSRRRCNSLSTNV